MASRISWFNLVNRKKFAFYGTFTLGIGFLSAKLFPNTFFLDNYQNVVQMYRLGMGVPVPKRITDRVEQVLEDMKVPHKERKLCKTFTVIGFDIFHAGSTNAKTGCIIGIPKSYAYDSLDDVERSEIIVNQKPVPWNTPEGKALQEAIVLSPEAQKYAIACQVSLCRTHYIFLLGLYPMLSTLFAYFLSSNLNSKLQLHNRRMLVRGIMYSIVGLFSFGLWAFANDFTTVKYEQKADLEACALGLDYARGGVELYGKILSRNVALRKLMGPEGAKLFTAFGNDEMLLRLKHMPITVRKSLVQNQLKDAMAKTESEHLEM